MAAFTKPIKRAHEPSLAGKNTNKMNAATPIARLMCAGLDRPSARWRGA